MSRQSHDPWRLPTLERLGTQLRDRENTSDAKNTDQIPAQQSSGRPRQSWRTSFAVAGGLVLIGAIIVVVSLTASTSTTPAYAVTVNGDGSVTLTLNEVLGVNGANKQLVKLGVRASVAKVEPGCTAIGEIVPVPSNTLSQQQMVETEKPHEGLSGLVWVIHPNAIPPGDTVLITVRLVNAGNPIATFNGRAISALSGSVSLYHGSAPACSTPQPLKASRVERHSR
jgi:hypothetical protein